MASAKKALSDIYRTRLLDLYLEGLKAVIPDTLISNIVSINENNLVIRRSDPRCSSLKINLETNNVHIVSFGKSAISMAKALGDVVINSYFKKSFRDGFVIAPCHLKKKFERDVRCRNIFQKFNLNCAFGAENNLPDEESLVATKDLLHFIENSVKDDVKRGLRSTFLVLIGGGGSACLTYPRFIDMNKKLELIKFLQRKGADIVELNMVRRFFSHVKGGKLAEYILNQGDNVDVISLIVSDVVGNHLECIASGPTVLESDDARSENRSREDMISVIKKYDYDGMADLLRDKGSDLTSGSGDNRKIPSGSRVKNLIIGDNSLAVRSAAFTGLDLGIDVKIIADSCQGFTDEILTNFIGNYCCPGKLTLVIGGGEATIRSEDGDTWGIGGRCQEMGLDYLIAKLDTMIDEEGSPDIEIFLAATTDGQDGPTNVAACLVLIDDILSSYKSLYSNLNHLEILDRLKLKAIEAKRSHNSNQFWLDVHPESLIRIGLTGTNVMDIYMLMMQK